MGKPLTDRSALPAAGEALAALHCHISALFNVEAVLSTLHTVGEAMVAANDLTDGGNNVARVARLGRAALVEIIDDLYAVHRQLEAGYV